MLKFTIKPYDVLFFGSGKPFNVGESAQSIFPPHPTTFAGAICSKIYAQKGINVSGILKAVYGPFIEKDGKIYFPKPQNIYGERKKEVIENFFIIEPKISSFKLFSYENTNKPKEIEKLPIYKGDEEIEPFEGFISIEGLKAWINNQEIEKEHILKTKDIFEYDQRIGIKINPSLYSVGGEEDALYRIKLLQLEEGISFVFWVEFNFSCEELKKANLNDEDKIFELFNNEPKVLKLGGEMRNVRYRVEENDFINYLKNELKLPEKIQIKQGDKIKVLFLSYGVFDSKTPKIKGFKIISMCFSNYSIIGINSKNLGIKTKRAFPPGTILWLGCESDKNINSVSFLIKNQNDYDFKEPQGNQDFIGTNLVLVIKKGG
ncbi:MAG: type III-B CRISPR module-associated protein Cmr3 [Candidatus Hydrothermia bacterium]|jgi:CRISPR-associated protein Cmr3|nr:type III-B CRISPR module-associated protein Cmr3 [Candidatus Hydrothermia bacterium]